MTRVLLCWLCVCVWTQLAFAQHPVEQDRENFTVTLEPAFVATTGAYVGGEIVMHVQYISANPFKRIRLELPIIEDARSDFLARPHTRQIEVSGDEGYSIVGSKGYSHDVRLAIVPVRGGTLVIPPITVTGISTRSDGRSVEFKEIHPQRDIVVHPKSPDFDGDAWIVSHQVTMEDSWSHVISEIQNGDTVRRTVSLTVAGMSADDLPELVLAAGEGYRVMNTEMSAETEKTTAGFVAHLRQSWDIYIETEDVTHIEGVTLPYWNPERATTEVAAVPGQRVEPLKRGAMELRRELRREALARHRAERFGLLTLFLMPAAALFVFLVLVIWRVVPTRADLRLWRDAVRSESSLDFYRSFLSWSRNTFGSDAAAGQAAMAGLGSRAMDHISRMHRSIFGTSGGDISPKSMAFTLIQASRRLTTARFLTMIVPGLARFFFFR